MKQIFISDTHFGHEKYSFNFRKNEIDRFIIYGSK